MAIVQMYETMLVDKETGECFCFLTIPARSLVVDPYVAAGNILSIFGVVQRVRVMPAYLVHAVEDMLEGGADLANYFDDRFFQQEVRWEPFLSREAHYSEFAEFAQQIALSPVVPFENSPLSLQSLASIASQAAKSGPVTLGSVVGFLAAGHSPMLLVTVPLGIVLCGTAVAYAKAVEEARPEIAKRLLGAGKDDQNTKRLR